MIINISELDKGNDELYICCTGNNDITLAYLISYK